VGSAEEIWYRTTATNFVSDYSAAHNPDEDFAETLAYYIYQPDLVRTVAPEKYRFVKEVVDGYEYVMLVDKQFTFQVFNLEPDRAFPGKIVGVDIEVYKQDRGDNRVVATLHLSPQFGGGAERAYARIVSRVQTYVDQYFFPVDGDPHRLRADFTMSKYAAAGYWLPEQITVSDKVDNRRYEGQAQFGWLLYLDNPDEDIEAPIADTERIRGEILKGVKETTVRITIPVADKNIIGIGGHGSLVHDVSGQNEGRYAASESATREIMLEFPIQSYRIGGDWTFREFWVFDQAKNERRYDLKEKALTFFIPTNAPDVTKPTLEVSSIQIQAAPKRPEAPDGETDVTIWYRASDDNSGLGLVSYTIVKPNGQTLFDYHYHENFYTTQFIGNPREPKRYQITLTLPPGSVPGTWILRDMTLRDKAGNTMEANFIETGILKPFTVF
jgi:hypothetical protein